MKNFLDITIKIIINKNLEETIFFIFIAVYGTPVLAIIFCLNLALIIDKSHNDKDLSLNVYLMTGAFTIMMSCITIALLTVLDGV